MASHTISGQRWADGTTVSVYPAAAWPDPTQAPSGSAVTTAAVAGGAVTFAGLAENVRYVAYAGGLGVRFVVPQVDPMDARSLRARVDELAGEVGPAASSRLDAVESRLVRYTPQQFEAYGLGLGSEGTQLQAGLTAAAGSIFEWGEGVWIWTGTLTIPSNTQIELHPQAILKPQSNQHAFIFDSPTGRTPATSYQLTVDSVVGAYTVTVSTSDSTHLTAGDRVTLRDATYSLGGINCRRETNVVESVNTGTGVITLQRPVGHVYTAANDSWIAKLTPASNIHIYGGQMDMDAVAGGLAEDCNGIYAEWPDNCSVNDLTIYNHPDAAVDFYGGIDSHLRRCIGYSADLTGPGEGITMRLGYSRDSTISGGWTRDGRHHADIVGGHNCHIYGGLSAGRTGNPQAGAFLHGLESRWCGIHDFSGIGVAQAVAAGNGSFGADFDFTFDGVFAHGCDEGVFINQGCRRGTVKAKAYSCVNRGYVNDNSTDMDVDVEVYDNLSTALASVTVSGASSGTFKVKIRTPAWKGMTVTQLAGAGRVEIDPDIDMGSVAQPAIDASSLVSGGEVVVKRHGLGRVKMNASSTSAVSLNGTADLLEVEGIDFSGSYLNAALIQGAPKRARFRRNNLSDSAASAEGVRFGVIGDGLTQDALAVTDNDFLMTSTSETAIRLASAVSSPQGNVADVHGNRYGSLTTRINNAGAVTLRGLVDVLTSTVAWDPASLTNGSSERKSITVTGAAVGDPVSAGLTTIAATGWDIQAAVIATNTVEVKITNNTGGTVDLANGTVRVVVEKFS